MDDPRLEEFTLFALISMALLTSKTLGISHTEVLEHSCKVGYKALSDCTPEEIHQLMTDLKTAIAILLNRHDERSRPHQDPNQAEG